MVARLSCSHADGARRQRPQPGPAGDYFHASGGRTCAAPGNFKDGWIGGLKTHRVILMDKRGTGLSTRLDATLSRFDTVDKQANPIKHFRADSMVEDAERLRAIINGGKPWASLVILRRFHQYDCWSPPRMSEVATSGLPAWSASPCNHTYRTA